MWRGGGGGGGRRCRGRVTLHRPVEEVVHDTREAGDEGEGGADRVGVGVDDGAVEVVDLGGGGRGGSKGRGRGKGGGRESGRERGGANGEHKEGEDGEDAGLVLRVSWEKVRAGEQKMKGTNEKGRRRGEEEGEESKRRKGRRG